MVVVLFMEEVKLVLVLLMSLFVFIVKGFCGVWDNMDENGFIFVEVFRVIVVVIDGGDVIVYNNIVVYLGIVII